MMILVSGSTRTVQRVAHVRPGQLGHLLTPSNRNSVRSLLATGLPIAADNGAFAGFDEMAFEAMLDRLCIGISREADSWVRLLWVVCPDKVGDARATLDLLDRWRGEFKWRGFPVAFVGQDGLENLDVPFSERRAPATGSLELSHERVPGG